MSTQTSVTAETLRTLHRIHRQLTDLRERLERGPRLARAHEANLKKLEEQLTKVRSEAKVFRVATDQKQLELQSHEAAVHKRKQQMLASTNNKEYQALREEIAAAEMANSVLADEILEALERLDDYAKKVARAEAALAKAHEEGDKACRDAQEQGPGIRAEIQRLEAQLKQCEAALADDFRDLYRRVVRQKGEDALAAINGEFCGGCNQHVPLHVINALMLSKPAFCKACGRLLYLPEDAAPR